MTGIIDSHVHRYPGEVIRDPLGWAAARGESNWADLVAPGGVQGWASRDKMLRDMDAAGVEKAVIQGWYWEHQATCDEANAWHAQWLREDPDRFIALASVEPRDGEAAVVGFKRALEAGCTGAGELHPWVQGWDFSNPAWNEIADICEARDLPVCFHATETVGPDYKGSAATPLNEYAALAKKRPKLKIVLAHWGGGLPFYLMNRRTKKALANVYYDTAASPLLYDARVWKLGVELAGADHILFGTDYPLLDYPSKTREPSFAGMVAEAKANLPQTAAQSVLRDNALNVYRGKAP
jgi:uncharacterized protein